VSGWPGKYWLQQVDDPNIPLDDPSIPQSSHLYLTNRSKFLLAESQPLQEKIRTVSCVIKSLSTPQDKKEREIQEQLFRDLTSDLFHNYLKEVALNRAKLWVMLQNIKH
jgi:hypothetical protein